MDGYWALVLALAWAAGCYCVLTLQGLARQQQHIEVRLDALSRHLGLLAAAGSEPSERVKTLAADRSTYVEALQAYRTETGTDLKRAKLVVDRLRPGRDSGRPVSE